MTIESKAMKSTEENISYPCLMESSSKIVLFTSPGVGTVVWSNKEAPNNYNVGYHADDWIMRLFSPFGGEVNLKNKE